MFSVNANPHCVPSVLLTQAGFSGPCTTHPSLIQKLESLTFGFVIKKAFFYLLQLQQNLLCVQGIILYTIIKLTDFFFSLVLLFSDAHPNLVFSSEGELPT